MAAIGVFRIPREFKDEDKWFRYFNKKQAIILVLTGRGITLDQWIFRVILRKSKKVIYTKNVEEGNC